MTRCLDEAKLQCYFDGELSLEQLESVTSHLASCATCAAAARELEEESALVMHRCPFRELAELYPRVVCGFHAGLIDGALAELDAPVRLGDLEPWATPTSCVARIGPRPARA